MRPSLSMNRIYYAMFYAVQALLALHGVSFSKHGQVKGYYNRELIKTGILPMEMGRLYNKAEEQYPYETVTQPVKKLSWEVLTHLTNRPIVCSTN